MARPGYQTTETKSKNNIKYFFISKGKQDVIKAIDYSFAGNLNEKMIFNLAFGDYNIEEDEIDDSMNTDNGDVYDVFYTVLNSIPKIFEEYPNEAIMVRGSDSGPEFIEKCKLDCKRKCEDENACRKQNRRINVYREYVNKNHDELINEYEFFGGIGDVVESYVKDKKYDTVFVIRKIS